MILGGNTDYTHTRFDPVPTFYFCVFLRPVVNCEDTPLENVFRFKYLVSAFTTDGIQLYDVKD